MLKVSIQEDTCISHWFSRRREDIGVLNSSCTMKMICKVTVQLNSPGLQAKSELSRPFRPRAAPTSCCYLLWAAFLPTCPALLKALSAPGDASTSSEAVVLRMPSPLLKCSLPPCFHFILSRLTQDLAHLSSPPRSFPNPSPPQKRHVVTLYFFGLATLEKKSIIALTFSLLVFVFILCA